MKIAYLISTYLDPQQLRKTIKSLHYKNLCDFYIHVDKKVNIEEFKKQCDFKNVYFIEKRVQVCWGGYSQVQSILAMIEKMIESNKKYDRVVNMTGLDYPVFSNEEIQEYFNKEKQFMIGLNITKANIPKQTRKIERYWFFDHNLKNRLWIQMISKIENTLFKILPIRKKKKIVTENGTYDIYFSSDYWCLTYDCVYDLYNEYKNNKKIQKYFKYAFAPSELFMSTMLFNSKYAKDAVLLEKKEYTNLASLTSLHYIDYQKSIKVLTKEDYEKIIKANKMFARKFRTGVSEELINLIENHKKNCQ